MAKKAKRKITRRTGNPKIKRKRRIKRRSPKQAGVNNAKKFKRSRRRILLTALKTGMSIKRACGVAGITYSTYKKWMERGRDSERPTYRLFRRKVRQIEAGIEKEALSVIRKAFKGGAKITESKYVIKPMGTEITKTTKEIAPNWQAAAWRLERRFPDDYGRVHRPPEDNEKTAEEQAREIKAAADVLFNSVPINGQISEAEIPADMPD